MTTTKTIKKADPKKAAIASIQKRASARMDRLAKKWSFARKLGHAMNYATYVLEQDVAQQATAYNDLLDAIELTYGEDMEELLVLLDDDIEAVIKQWHELKESKKSNNKLCTGDET